MSVFSLSDSSVYRKPVLSFYSQPLSSKDSILTKDGRVKQYAELTTQQQNKLDSFVRGQIITATPFGRQLGAELLKPYLQYFLRDTSDFPSLKVNLGKLQRILKKLKTYPLPKLSPIEELYARILNCGSAIPMCLNNQLTLNQALRSNQPFVFNRVLQGIDPLFALEEKALLNEKDPIGLTALHTAILTRHLPEAKALLQKGANPFIPDAYGKSALKLLAEQGQQEKMDYLLQQTEPKFKKKHAEDIQLLQQEVVCNRVWIDHIALHYQQLSAEDIQANLYGILDSGIENVHAEKDKLIQLLALIEVGANINVVDDEGNTPLHDASILGRDDIANALILSGANVNQRNNKGETALHCATDVGHERVVSALINAGARIDARDRKGRTALHLSAREGHERIANLLISAGAKPDAPDLKGKTARFWALQSGFDGVASMLSRAEATPREAV